MNKIEEIYNLIYNKNINVTVPELNELDDAFDSRQMELERYAIKKNPLRINFNEHLKVQDEIIEMLIKLKVKKEFVNKIKEKFEIQTLAFGNELEFWEYYFFKAGATYMLKLRKELNDEMDEIGNKL